MTSTAITIIIILVEFGRADGSLMDVAENVNITFKPIQFNSFQFENALFLVPSCIMEYAQKNSTSPSNEGWPSLFSHVLWSELFDILGKSSKNTLSLLIITNTNCYSKS